MVVGLFSAFCHCFNFLVFSFCFVFLYPGDTLSSLFILDSYQYKVRSSCKINCYSFCICFDYLSVSAHQLIFFFFFFLAGGKKFCTTVDTLTQREPYSMLAAMFSGRHTVCQDPEKVYTLYRVTCFLYFLPLPS